MLLDKDTLHADEDGDEREGEDVDQRVGNPVNERSFSLLAVARGTVVLDG